MDAIVDALRAAHGAEQTIAAERFTPATVSRQGVGRLAKAAATRSSRSRADRSARGESQAARRRDRSAAGATQARAGGRERAAARELDARARAARRGRGRRRRARRAARGARARSASRVDEMLAADRERSNLLEPRLAVKRTLDDRRTRPRRHRRDPRAALSRSGARSIPRTSPSWPRTSTRRCGWRSRESPAGDTLKVAVLAALNIADEYFRARDDEQRRTRASAHRAARARTDARSGARLATEPLARRAARAEPGASACLAPGRRCSKIALRSSSSLLCA